MSRRRRHPPIGFEEIPSAAPSRRRNGTIVGIVAGLVAVVAAAVTIVAGYERESSTVASTEEQADYTVPIAQGAALPAGTPIRDGFEVPEGVYDTLASQARAIGYQEVEWSGDACQVDIEADGWSPFVARQQHGTTVSPVAWDQVRGR